jgi:hypothetical protein
MRQRGALISPDIFDALFDCTSPFPPVIWFERIVNSAFHGYWKQTVQQHASAARD